MNCRPLEILAQKVIQREHSKVGSGVIPTTDFKMHFSFDRALEYSNLILIIVMERWYIPRQNEVLNKVGNGQA